MSLQSSTCVKWFGNICFVFATISLLSPIVASTALFPWIAYLIGNSIWVQDSYMVKNWPLFWLATFFCTWDALLIVARSFGVQFFSVLQPLVIILEKLP